MAAPTRSSVLSLYKQMIKEGSKITDYNFRMYALRRTRDAFRENKAVADSQELKALVTKANENLDILKRQSVISQLFGAGKFAIESQPDKVKTSGSSQKN